jgi:hypothetical protein
MAEGRINLTMDAYDISVPPKGQDEERRWEMGKKGQSRSGAAIQKGGESKETEIISISYGTNVGAIARSRRGEA